MEKLLHLKPKNQKLAIGLISGTSVDGVDAALVRIKGYGLDTELDLQEFLTFPYPDGLKEHLLVCSTPGRGSVDQICSLNAILGEIFSDAVFALLEKTNIEPNRVDFIGSHGQTVQHLPKSEKAFGYTITSTLQLGDPSVIAKRTGILTVGDFRPADMALGGQGAPLVPYFDFVLFRSTQKNRILLNIGGIANLTLLKKGASLPDLIAYDTGPGNMVIDCLMQKLFSRPYDNNGEIASSGQVSEELLGLGLAHSYFEKPPPKSTGREEFGEAFSGKFLSKAQELGLAANDIIATATELTVQSIWQSYERDIAPDTRADEFIVSGGGTLNFYIMKLLQQKMDQIVISTSDDYGIPSAAKEAICFAVLANETLAGNPNNVPSATGASAATILGKICL